MSVDKKAITPIYPPNIGWLEYNLTDPEMEYMWRCIKNKKGDYKNELAGNIGSSYKLVDRGDWFWLNVIVPLCVKYEEVFVNMAKKYPTSGKHPFYLDTMWVNFQKQGEFNPSHSHSGVYSFVIWMKEPVKHAEQNKKDISRRSNNPKLSTFEFQYLDMLGLQSGYSYRCDPQNVGKMLFFPSLLSHQVYPFMDCDEERVSVSGNVLLNTAKLQ